LPFKLDLNQGAGIEGNGVASSESSGNGAGAEGRVKSEGKPGEDGNTDGGNADAKGNFGDRSSSSGGGSGEGGTEGTTGGILLNSGRRIGMGLKLGLVKFAEDVDADEEWRMSVQNSARKNSGISDSPFDSIFQLRQALNPTFPVDFDSNTTTPSSSTPYIPTPSTPYIPINAEEVMSVLNALEEKGEDSDAEKEEDRAFEFSNSSTVSITVSGICSPVGSIPNSDAVSEQSLRASLASRAARSRRA
jgi:hypothetical protein